MTASLVGVVALLVLAIAAQAAQGSHATPSLRLVDMSPVRLAGVGFSPGERVRVRVWSGSERQVRRVRANSRGRFRASFTVVGTHDPCNEWLAATASGSAGHGASLKRPPRLCPPALDPPAASEEDAPPMPAGGPCGRNPRDCPPAPASAR